MNMPGFNADATLYKTSGHYQTSRNMINLPTQMGSSIYAAMEVIEVEGCRPGLIQLGEGENMVCIDPNDPFGGGHDGGGGPSGGGPSDTGGGGSPPKPPPKPPKKIKCECSPGCAEKGGDPCKVVTDPGSSEPRCKGSCFNSEGNDCGVCQEVPVTPIAHRILRTKMARLL